MPLRTRIRGLRSRSLLTYIAATDSAIWLIGFPFELYCRSVVASHHASVTFLLLVLVTNAALLALMASSAAGTAMLATRAFAFKRRPSV